MLNTITEREVNTMTKKKAENPIEEIEEIEEIIDAGDVPVQITEVTDEASADAAADESAEAAAPAGAAEDEMGMPSDPEEEPDDASAPGADSAADESAAADMTASAENPAVVPVPEQKEHAPEKPGRSEAMRAAQEFTKNRRRGGRTAEAPRLNSTNPALTARSRARTAAPELRQAERQAQNTMLQAVSAARSAMNGNRMISDLKVTNVVQADEKHEGEPAAVVLLGEGRLPVFIPYGRFFERPVDNMRANQKYNALRACIGAKIDVAITSVEEVPSEDKSLGHVYTAHGDRVRAMRYMQARTFGPTARDRVEKGSVLVGKVRNLHRNGGGMTITVGGIDKVLVLSNITSQFVNNVNQTKYRTGSDIYVCVEKIARDAKGYVKSIEVSARSYEDKENDKNVRRLIVQKVLTPGTTALGVVRNITIDEATGAPTYYVRLNDLEVDVRATGSYVDGTALSKMPSRGCSVRVKISFVSENNRSSGLSNRFTGVIVENLGISGENFAG